MSIWTGILETIATLRARGEALIALFDRADDPPQKSVAFTIAVISLSAKMAKADGRVAPSEVSAFRQVFLIDPQDEASAARVFDLAREDVAGFEAYARSIASMFRDQPDVLEDILEGLFHIAMADDAYHAGEEAFLRRVAEIFGVQSAAFDCIEARRVSGSGSDPWQALGLARDVSLAEARERWRTLVRENHPDRMMARGLPAETINLANARLVAINRAWEEIRVRSAPRRTDGGDRSPAT